MQQQDEGRRGNASSYPTEKLKLPAETQGITFTKKTMQMYTIPQIFAFAPPHTHTQCSPVCCLEGENFP